MGISEAVGLAIATPTLRNVVAVTLLGTCSSTKAVQRLYLLLSFFESNRQLTSLLVAALDGLSDIALQTFLLV